MRLWWRLILDLGIIPEIVGRTFARCVGLVAGMREVFRLLRNRKGRPGRLLCARAVPGGIQTIDQPGGQKVPGEDVVPRVVLGKLFPRRHFVVWAKLARIGTEMIRNESASGKGRQENRSIS